MLEAGAGFAPEPEVAAAVTAAARAFERAGAIVEPLAPFFTRAMLDGLDRFWRMRAWAEMRRLPPERLAKVLPFIRAWAEGAAGLSGLEVFEGAEQMMVIRRAAVRACQGFDYVLSPTAPIPAFPAALPAPTDDPARPFEHIGFTVPFNFSEQPAVSVHCAMTGDGLPIGLQIIGRRFDDLGVLQLAHAWERLRGAPPHWPDPRP